MRGRAESFHKSQKALDDTGDQCYGHCNHCLAHLRYSFMKGVFVGKGGGGSKNK